MSRDKQIWTPFPSEAPYDEIVFPHDDFVQDGAPNEWSHKFFDGTSRTADSVVGSIVDPANKELKKRVKTFLDICLDVHYGFVALGISRLLPRWLQFLVRDKVERLYKYAELTVRDAQHAVLSLGYSADDLIKNCPKAPAGDEVDPTIRRLKAVLTHPIGTIAALLFCIAFYFYVTSNIIMLLLHRRLRRPAEGSNFCSARCNSKSLF